VKTLAIARKSLRQQSRDRLGLALTVLMALSWHQYPSGQLAALVPPLVLLVHAATAMGIRVIAHDRIAAKMKMACDFGAFEGTGPGDARNLWEKENVTSVFECAGASSTLELALEAAPRGANVILLGLSASPASFVPMRLVREGINIFTSMIYDHPSDFARTIELVDEGKLHPGRVVTHTFSLDSVAEALKLADTGEAGKIHITI